MEEELIKQKMCCLILKTSRACKYTQSHFAFVKEIDIDSN